jgi:hypothetical protein
LIIKSQEDSAFLDSSTSQWKLYVKRQIFTWPTIQVNYKVIYFHIHRVKYICEWIEYIIVIYMLNDDSDRMVVWRYDITIPIPI